MALAAPTAVRLSCLLLLLSPALCRAKQAPLTFPEEERLALKEDAREMFYHAYSAYMVSDVTIWRRTSLVCCLVGRLHMIS